MSTNVPAARRIDSHQHFWRYMPEDYAWIDASMPELRRDFLPEDLMPLLAGHHFDGSVAVQARMHPDETDFLVSLAAANDFICGVVGWIDLCAPDVEEVLERHAEIPVLKGYRHQVQDEPSPSAFLEDSAFNNGVAAVLRAGKMYEILVHSKDIPAAARFAARHEGQLVLDHFGKPDVRGESLAAWRMKLEPLAAMEHVSCKLSGLITEAVWHNWKREDLAPYIETALALFGPSRLLFGSDWPVCLLSGSYGEVYGLAEYAMRMLSASERECVFGGNACRMYNLDVAAF